MTVHIGRSPDIFLHWAQKLLKLALKSVMWMVVWTDTWRVTSMLTYSLKLESVCCIGREHRDYDAKFLQQESSELLYLVGYYACAVVS